ncbi:MAG TPA: hypothetical protein VGN72_08720 [Tepidisphaeraceae bacterium]|jgi:hypothetical protein|nr:hypothetical protein [Tepidisphaeraceae bacterium]
MRLSKILLAAIVGAISVVPQQLAVAQAPTSQPTTSAVVYETPEAVVLAARNANKTGDHVAEIDCYSPAGHAAIARVLMWMIASPPTTQSATQPINPDRAAFEARHGLDRRAQKPGESRDDFAKRLVDELPDKRAFLLDFMTKQPPRRRPTSQPAGPLQLQDVTIDPSGTTATAKLVRKGRDGSTMSQEVKFEKIDGSWRIATMMMY